jgi:hypothetical protein
MAIFRQMTGIAAYLPLVPRPMDSNPCEAYDSAVLGVHTTFQSVLGAGYGLSA